MLAVTPSSICWRVSSRKSRGGGPALLLTRMSGSGAAANSAACPSGVATSAATAVTLAPVMALISSAVACTTAASRPLTMTWHPACASAVAQARPSPRLDAQTMAVRPAIPRSIALPLVAIDRGRSIAIARGWQSHADWRTLLGRDEPRLADCDRRTRSRTRRAPWSPSGAASLPTNLFGSAGDRVMVVVLPPTCTTARAFRPLVGIGLPS